MNDTYYKLETAIGTVLFRPTREDHIWAENSSSESHQKGATYLRYRGAELRGYFHWDLMGTAGWVLDSGGTSLKNNRTDSRPAESTCDAICRYLTPALEQWIKEHPAEMKQAQKEWLQLQLAEAGGR